MIEIINNLKSGKIVAIPTDTVYGLICDATNENAIKKMYEIKKRDANKAISIFIKSIDQVYNYVDDFNDDVKKLMLKYWPGPLTIIFKKKVGVLPFLNPNYSTIGIRIPDNKLLLNILNNVTFPIAQTSCNISGYKPYYNSIDIKKDFSNKIDLIVDGNLPIDSISSTIIDVSTGSLNILRHGAICGKERF